MAAPLIWHDYRQVLILALDEALARSEDSGSAPPALVLVDLDSYARMEHRSGAAEADRVMDEIQNHLVDAAGELGLVVRLYLDKFALVLADAGQAGGRLAAEEIQRAVRGLESPPAAARPGLSIGIRAADPGQAPADVIRDAGVALDAAKAYPADPVKVFEPFMLHALEARRRLGRDLTEAVRTGGLEVAYQPIVELPLPSGGPLRVQGVEALARWTTPGFGPVPPDTFIPLAEELGVAVELDRVVLDRALAQLHVWQQEMSLEPDFTVSVNISPPNLQHLEYLDQVRLAVTESGIAPRQLVLELTEASFVAGNETDLYSLHGLARLGVGLDIDDFGTGYSSIGYLRRLPVHRVKIDRSLLGNLAEDPQQRLFLQRVVDLIRTCGLSTVVEGIETAEQAEAVASLGAGSGQGYFFCRPLPAEEMTAFLQAHQSRSP